MGYLGLHLVIIYRRGGCPGAHHGAPIVIVDSGITLKAILLTANPLSISIYILPWQAEYSLGRSAICGVYPYRLQKLLNEAL